MTTPERPKNTYLEATLEAFIEELKMQLEKNPFLKDYLVKLVIPDNEAQQACSVVHITGFGIHKTEKEFYLNGPPLEWLVVKNYLEDKKYDNT